MLKRNSLCLLKTLFFFSFKEILLSYTARDVEDMFLYEMEDFYNEYYLFFIFQYFQLKKKCKFEIFNI